MLQLGMPFDQFLKRILAIIVMRVKVKVNLQVLQVKALRDAVQCTTRWATISNRQVRELWNGRCDSPKRRRSVIGHVVDKRHIQGGQIRHAS